MVADAGSPLLTALRFFSCARKYRKYSASPQKMFPAQKIPRGSQKFAEIPDAITEHF